MFQEIHGEHSELLRALKSGDARSSRSPEVIVRMAEVCALTTLSRATIYRKMKRGTFPSNRQLSANRMGWRLKDVLDWIVNSY